MPSIIDATTMGLDVPVPHQALIVFTEKKTASPHPSEVPTPLSSTVVVAFLVLSLYGNGKGKGKRRFV